MQPCKLEHMCHNVCSRIKCDTPIGAAVVVVVVGIAVSQYVPVQSDVHVHVDVHVVMSVPSTHVPPFLQGLDSQSESFWQIAGT
jgi:hypothetical protein